MNKNEVIEKHFKLLTEHFSRNEYHIAIPWISEAPPISYGGYGGSDITLSAINRIERVEITRDEFLAHKWNSKLWKTMYGER